MRIDDFALLFQVKCFFMALHLRGRVLAIVVLAVVREESLWVWVSHETISAASCS